MRLRDKVVLLVEDDADNLELLATCLEAEGASVVQASKVTEALELSLGVAIDVVVSDLQLSDGNGCDLLRRLRRRADMTDVPAVAISGYSEDQWYARSSTSSFVRHVVKPFALERLIDAIDDLCGERQGSRSTA
jgi:CheY-like chemotaxis protein